MATANDILALLKGYLKFDEVATQQLADAFEETGDTEMAEEVRSGVVWFTFSNEKDKFVQRMGVKLRGLGPELYFSHVNNGSTRVATVMEKLDDDEYSLLGIELHDPRLEDWPAKLVFNKEGHLEVLLHTSLQNDPDGFGLIESDQESNYVYRLVSEEDAEP